MDASYETRKIRQGYACVIGCDEVGRGCLAGPVVAAAVLLPVESLKFKVKSLQGIKDSKLLSAKKREALDRVIKEHAVGWGIGVVDPKIIDSINIHYASLLSMRRAVENLLGLPNVLLQDLKAPRKTGLPATLGAPPKIRKSLPPEKVVSLPVNPPAGRVELIYAAGGQTARKDAGEVLLKSKGMLLAIDGKFNIPLFSLDQEAIVDGDAKILSIAAASIIAKVFRDSLMKGLDEKYPGYNFSKHKGYATLRHCEVIRNIGLSPVHRVSFCRQYL